MLYFPEPPAIQALNCMPAFKPSRAEVKVESSTGVVQYYHILDTPLREDVAWPDAFQWRNFSDGGQHNRSYMTDYEYIGPLRFIYDLNVTIR